MKNDASNFKEVGRRMNALREAQGLSMRELAARASIAVSHLSKIESGQSSPTIMTLQKLLEALGHDLASFFAAETAVNPAEQVVFPKGSMKTLAEVDRMWRLAYPPHPDIRVHLSWDEYRPHTQIREIQKHPHDLYGLVFSGTLTLEIPGRGTFEAHRGDAFFLAANTPHISANHGDALVRLAVVHLM